MTRRYRNDDSPVASCLAALIVAVIFGSLYTALDAAILMWAWNLALVPLFHVPAMGYEVAIGLVVLLSVVGSFFKSAKGGSHD